MNYSEYIYSIIESIIIDASLNSESFVFENSETLIQRPDACRCSDDEDVDLSDESVESPKKVARGEVSSEAMQKVVSFWRSDKTKPLSYNTVKTWFRCVKSKSDLYD